MEEKWVAAPPARSMEVRAKPSLAPSALFVFAQGDDGMRGYVLADLEVGAETEFFNALGSVPQLLHVYHLFDQFDNLFDRYEYLLELEGESAEELIQVMRTQIRHLPGVERTAVFVAKDLGKFPPMDRSRRADPVQRPS